MMNIGVGVIVHQLYSRTAAVNIQLNKIHKVLVTGGAGFFGSHICEKLLLDGKQVVVVDSLNNESSSVFEKKRYIEYLKLLSENIDGSHLSVYEIDILEEERLSDILRIEGPVSCIHAASLVMDRKSVEEPIRYIINNVQGTQSILNAIRRTGTIKRFVLISSRAAVGETNLADDQITENDLLRPINPYGATKVAMEALCHAFYKNFGLSVVICRMQPLYGPRSRRDMMPRLLFESILYNRVVKKYGNGEAVRDWLYVEDAALGILAAIERSDGFSIFNFGTGTVTTLNELIRLVVEITGGKLNMQFESVPPGDAIFTGSCDTRKAKDLLGWEPKIDLRTGLKMMYEDMKMHRYDECGNILIDSNVLYEKI
ncbi:MAG: GDP-mannose 4,6-dehydratase [Anaerolineales bacterium]|jgi:UDP-glucuronate 4-epimerase